MLGHSEPLRMRSESNDGVMDHIELRSGGTATAAIHNSLQSLCRRYTRSQIWEQALRVNLWPQASKTSPKQLRASKKRLQLVLQAQ